MTVFILFHRFQVYYLLRIHIRTMCIHIVRIFIICIHYLFMDDTDSDDLYQFWAHRMMRLFSKNSINRCSFFSAIEFEEKENCNFKKLRFNALISTLKFRGISDLTYSRCHIPVHPSFLALSVVCMRAKTDWFYFFEIFKPLCLICTVLRFYLPKPHQLCIWR